VRAVVACAGAPIRWRATRNACVAAERTGLGDEARAIAIAMTAAATAGVAPRRGNATGRVAPAAGWGIGFGEEFDSTYLYRTTSYAIY